MNYDKINKDVAFIEESHKYFNVNDPSINYISVTTLIGKYSKPFDSIWISKYKALERLMPVDIWKKEKLGSCCVSFCQQLRLF